MFFSSATCFYKLYQKQRQFSANGKIHLIKYSIMQRLSKKKSVVLRWRVRHSLPKNRLSTAQLVVEPQNCSDEKKAKSGMNFFQI